MKIPQEAKLVFKGVIFDVYQWEQKLFGGTTVTFEALKRPDTVLVIPTINETILLSHEEQPTYARKLRFFGGRVEIGESPEDAVKRELLEETGLESQDWELYKMYPFEGKIDWDVYYFIARDCHKVREPHLDPGEDIEVRSCSFEEFIQITTNETFDDTQFANEMLHIKLDPQKLEPFRKRLFLR